MTPTWCNLWVTSLLLDEDLRNSGEFGYFCMLQTNRDNLRTECVTLRRHLPVTISSLTIAYADLPPPTGAGAGAGRARLPLWWLPVQLQRQRRMLREYKLDIILNPGVVKHQLNNQTNINVSTLSWQCKYISDVSPRLQSFSGCVVTCGQCGGSIMMTYLVTIQSPATHHRILVSPPHHSRHIEKHNNHWIMTIMWQQP